MGWVFAQIYDFQMREVERACLGAWREALLSEARGRVLEIGAGTGANLLHYPEDVEVVLAEPDVHMRRKLAARMRDDGLGGEVVAGSAERIEVADQQFDTVVSTLVLCSVLDLGASLREIRRVLKPGGRLLFLEHVGAEAGSGRLRWQRRLEPVWKRVAGNCHLTRDTVSAIEAAGFEIDQVKRESMRKALPIVRPTARGVAIKALR